MKVKVSSENESERKIIGKIVEYEYRNARWIWKLKKNDDNVKWKENGIE